MRDAVRIAARLRELSPSHPGSGLAELACHVLALAAHDAQRQALLGEVAGLREAIAAMRREVALLSADDIAGTQIPAAADELDAIVTHTALATETILECCESLDTLAAGLPARAARAVMRGTTRVYEACCFQDITGQRIAKVVATLQTIEARLASLHGAFAQQQQQQPGAPGRLPAATGLLNGPQLPASALAQADVDRLLAAG